MQRVIRPTATVLLAATGLLVVAIAPAHAADDCSVGAGSAPSRLSSSVVVRGECEDAPPSRAVSPMSASEGEVEPEPVWALEPVWGVRSGEPCVDLVVSDVVTVNDPLGLVWEARMLEMLHDPRLAGVERRWCGVDGDAVMADPSPVARQFVRSVGLPEPELWVAPGVAVTGMEAFLEIGGQRGFVVEEQVAGFGRLEVALAPSWVVVDWGDGTLVTVDDGRLGAPWDGPLAEQISHVYVDADADSQVWVQVGWEAVWRLAGFSGVVDDLQVEATLDLPVETRRAVRTAPEHMP